MYHVIASPEYDSFPSKLRKKKMQEYMEPELS